MKKLLLLTVSVLCTYLYMAAETPQTPDRDSYEVELEKTPIVEGTGELGFPRSIYFLEAYYNPVSGIVDITHDNLGEMVICLLDSSGRIVYQTRIYSFGYNTDSIIVPNTLGLYTLVIESEVIYAYGTITTR